MKLILPWLAIASSILVSPVLGADPVFSNALDRSFRPTALSPDLVPLTDGRLMVVLNSVSRGLPYLTRLLSNGAIDPSFNPKGDQPYGDYGRTHVVAFPSNQRWQPQALDSKGRLVLLRREHVAITDSEVTDLIRFQAPPDEHFLDFTFGDNFPAEFRGAQALLVQADDKIVVVGPFGLGRLLEDGQKDTGFRPDYPVLGPTGTPSGLFPEWATALAQASSGGFYIAGRTVSPASTNHIIRVSQNGSIDPSFRPSVVFPIDRTNLPTPSSSLIVQPDGRLLFWAQDRPNPPEFGGFSARLVRLLPSGEEDRAFDPEKRLIDPFGDLPFALLPDGRIWFFGRFGNWFPNLHRLLPDGTMDPSWQLPRQEAVRALLGTLPNGDVIAYAGTRGSGVPWEGEQLGAVGHWTILHIRANPPASGFLAGMVKVLIPYEDPHLTVDVANLWVLEFAGTARIVCRRLGDASQPASIEFKTTDGTALAGQDFDAVAGTLTFAAGETQKVIEVPIRNDDSAEGDETFHVVFASPQGIAEVHTVDVPVTIVDTQAGVVGRPSLAIGRRGSEVYLKVMGRVPGYFTVITSSHAIGPGPESWHISHQSREGGEFPVDLESLTAFYGPNLFFRLEFVRDQFPFSTDEYGLERLPASRPSLVPPLPPALPTLSAQR